MTKNEGKTMRENTMYENMIAVTNRQLYLQAAEKNRCRDGKEDEEVSEAFLPGTRLWNRYLKQAEQVLSLSPKALVLREKDLEPEVYRQLAKDVTALCEAAGTECIVHSLAEAREAEALGADYLFAGNIFETDCKKGLPGRGLSFLQEVCKQVSIPVYGIGGITPDRMEQLLLAGASGGCMMSGFLKLQGEKEA